MHGGITNVVMRSICVVIVSVLLVFTMYYMRDYIHAVLLWTELQPPYTVFIIFVALYTLVSLPVVWVSPFSQSRINTKNHSLSPGLHCD